MTRYGVIVKEQVSAGLPVEERLKAVDEWIAKAHGVRPSIAPIWAHRYPPSLDDPWDFDTDMARGLRDRGIQPVIYMETTGIPYREIIAGKWDKDLRLLGARAQGLGVRIDQEMDGFWGAKWQAPEERLLFNEAWVHMRGILRDEGECKLIWCPVLPKRAEDAGLFPGAGNVDIMAFDSFSYRPDSKPPEERWPRLRDQLRMLAPTKPVWVCETGTDAGNPKRGEFIESIGRVSGIEAVAIFDMRIYIPPSADHPTPIDDDWRWSAAMYRRWAALP